MFIVDLYDQLGELQMVIGDYCDTHELVNELSLLLASVSMLYVRDSLSESVEAMEIHVNSFCKYTHNVFNTMRIRQAIYTFMRELHDILAQCGMYADGPYLEYTFGGWRGEFTALFVPVKYVHLYPEARRNTVDAEPRSTNPLDIYFKFNNLDRGIAAAYNVDETLPY